MARAERRYTLEEAKRELNKAECVRFGHDYRVMLTIGRNDPERIYCQRCGLGWKVTS